MKLPNWDRKFQQWDRYEAFHIGILRDRLVRTNWYNSPAFIMFETGELICTTRTPSLHPHRGEYPLLNVSLFASGDQKCPTLYTPEGEEVKKAWLKEGGWRYLLIDHDHDYVVGLGGTLVGVPERFKGLAAYYAGPSSRPQGSPIEVSHPNRTTLTKDERSHIEGMIASMKAMNALRDMPWTPTYYYDNWLTNLTVDDLLEINSVAELTEKQQRALLWKRVRRRRTAYPYLLTKRV